jgi:long-chain acyl-CoA synthetase
MATHAPHDGERDMTATSARPWLEHYPPGVPADIGPLPFPTIPEMMAASVQAYAGRPAFENFGVQLTFGDVDRLSRDFAAYLQSSLGLRKGDRVAVMMPNMLQYPIALFGILRAGMIVVSVNPLYTARELEHQLKDSGAQAIVIYEGAAATLQSVLRATPVRHVIIASVGDMLGAAKGTMVNFVLRRVKKMVPTWSISDVVRFPQALAAGKGQRFTPPAIDTEDLAFLQYTGGTTGVSKGAMLKHRNVLADVEQCRLHFSPVISEGGDIAVAPLPFYHILALVLNCMMFFRIGGKQILITNPRDIPRLVKTLDGSGFTFFVGVNTLFNALAHNAEFARLDFSSVKVFGGGGAPIQMAVAERWKQITGKTLIEGYGLTETSGAATANDPRAASHSGTAGFPIPGTEIEIRDDFGRALPLGETGQVYIRGPQVMAGYWNRPEDTAKAIGPDGYFATGDVGILTQDGYLRIVDRLKDMVLVSGFNVFPNEVEDVLAAHPGILEAAVVGVPDPQSGEAVKAFIVKKDMSLTAADVIAYCRENLTGYKIPRHIEFRDVLPKSPVGKILRRELRGQ